MIYSNDLKNGDNKQGVSERSVQLVYKHANAPKFYGGNRPLTKLAYAEEFEGDAERRTAAYSSVREDSSTASTYKLPAEVEFCKRSIASKQKGIPSTIELTGIVYIKYVDPITKLNVGDVKLLLNDDTLSLNKGDYENLKSSGYIKAKIFDGLVWQNISISELCTEKEYKFTKRQKAIDSALLCKTIIEDRRGIMLYRTYRGHFTTQER